MTAAERRGTGGWEELLQSERHEARPGGGVVLGAVADRGGSVRARLRAGL